MLHKPFRHHLRVFETHRTWSETSYLSLKNSSYEPHKWLYFMLPQAHMSKNGFSRVPNRFLKNFFWQCRKVFWDGNKVFWVQRTLQNLSMIISWHFEAIWKNRKKSSFFIFLGFRVKHFMKDLAIFEHKKSWKLFFQN